MTKALPQPPRTRFAPSPTGTLHIGNVRTALYGYLYAKKHGGSFIVRIEDTDKTREVPGSKEGILHVLEALGIRNDEGPYLSHEEGEMERLAGEKGEYGPYTQSERLDIYDEHIDKLVDQGDAYPCFCTPERLQEMRTEQQKAGKPPMYDRTCCDLDSDETHKRIEAGESYVIRMKVPEDVTITLHDAVYGDVEYHSSVVDDQVLIKSDHFPTYHFASVVDDHLMGITHVMRGNEWLPSSPKHILLYDMLGWEPPTFVHAPLLLNTDKSKLSKRQGDVAAEEYLANGYLPSAIVNFIALLGWNPKTEQEVFPTMDELMEAFSLENINKAGAVFDLKRLDWMNQQHVKELDISELLALAHPFYVSRGYAEEAAKMLGASNKEDDVVTDYLMKSLSIERGRLTKLSDIGQETEYLFRETLEYPADRLVWKKSTAENAKTYLQAVTERLAEQKDDRWTAESLEEDLIAWTAEQGWMNGDVLWPLRVALTGEERSPGPFESLWALGRERSQERIAAALTRLAT